MSRFSVRPAVPGSCALHLNVYDDKADVYTFWHLQGSSLSSVQLRASHQAAFLLLATNINSQWSAVYHGGGGTGSAVILHTWGIAWFSVDMIFSRWLTMVKTVQMRMEQWTWVTWQSELRNSGGQTSYTFTLKTRLGNADEDVCWVLRHVCKIYSNLVISVSTLNSWQSLKTTPTCRLPPMKDWMMSPL